MEQGSQSQAIRTEELKHKETAPSAHLENLLEFDVTHPDERVLELKERLQKNRGAMRVIVHPYYEANLNAERHANPEYQKRNPNIAIVEQGLIKMIEMASEKSPPIVIFEDKHDLTTTTKRLCPYLEKSKGTIYVVPTHWHDPAPQYSNVDDSPDGPYQELETMKKERGEHWEKFLEMLRSLGVKSIVVGGMLLEDKGDESSIILKQCVADAAEHLREFSPKISNFSHPVNRAYILDKKKRIDNNHLQKAA